ncbi:Integrase [Caenispirillum bisanense]|uniref:Integrase n=1 Tax=Caenispirillum bisanense TaxID=414052 RepID=A0A286GM42_9PROT|nr:Integrase [Caenispirillum bisanense]
MHPVKEYTRNHIRAFRDALLLKPKHISGSDRDLSFPTLIEKYRDQDVERVSRVSAKKLFSFVRSLFNTAINLHDLNESPTAGITISAPVSETDREPFSEDELRTMFSAAPFSPLNKSDDYWFILLSLFSGTRASELVQLRPEDLQEEGGIPFLDVSTSGGRTLKTKSSRRRLPVHPLLIHLGFVDWAKNRKGRIFNGIPIGRAQISDPASKRFNRWLDDIGISRPEVSLHSFRHTFKTMCRAANLDEHVSDVLSGHAPTSVARRYGKMPLEVLAEAMNRITCPVNIP